MKPSQTKEATQMSFYGCCPTHCLASHKTRKPLAKKRTSSLAENRRSFASITTSCLFPNTEFTNPESLPTLEEAYALFIKAYPKYLDTNLVDETRTQEYYHLSISNHVCLDYIGIGLFTFSQLHKQFSPTHEKSPKSSAAAADPPHSSDFPVFHLSYKSVNLKNQLLQGGNESNLESAIKNQIRGFLNMSENDYALILTADRTTAFRLLAESYPFRSYKKLLTVYDHESEAIQTMISSSEKRGAKTMAAEFTWPRLRIHSSKLMDMITRSKNKKKGLFSFQLQSRMTGVRYSYQWMREAQKHGWHILLDACDVGPKDMDTFGLSIFQPDFLVCSFYKVFGDNPSGFGCLFVKKSVISILETSITAGIVSIVSANKLLRLADESSSTNNVNLNEQQQFDSNPTVECRCLNQINSLGISMMNSRIRYLINWLIIALMKLQHPNSENGIPLVSIYGPKVKYDRGPALAFNLFDWKGDKLDRILVQKLADRKNISLGCGFLRHITFSEKYEKEKIVVIEKEKGCKENSGKKRKEKECLGIMVVTAAFGFIANFEDAYRLWEFVAQFLDADFVEKEKWRYAALNQHAVEI